MLTESQKSCIEATLEDVEREALLEFQFLFALAGRLRGAEAGLRQSDRRVAKSLVPVALEFAAKVSEGGLSNGVLDWSDPDSVALEFEKAWSSRRLPKDTRIFEAAITISETNLLGLAIDRNRWVNRIANLGFCLSEMLPDTPILIPISDRTAGMLGTSLRTLSLAVQEAIRERMLIVLEKPNQELPSRRARRLKFNSKNKLIANHIDSARKQFRDALSKWEQDSVVTKAS